eukprot:c22076_g1_i1 orf=145-861(+)
MATVGGALDDAVALLDTIIARLRTPTPLQPTKKAIAEKTEALPSGQVSVSCGAQTAISSSEGSLPPANGPDLTEDFDKACFQVGHVVSVDDHPVAEKLYVCKVETAPEQFKQVVTGLRKILPSSELLGKKVCLVLNLKPAKLAGTLSEAMILTGDIQIDGSQIVKLLQPPSTALVGDRIYLEGSVPSAKPAKQLSSKVWEKLLPLLHIRGGVAKFNQQCLVTSSGAVTAPVPDGSSIH